MAAKWKNPFCTCVDGLSTRLQSQPCGRTQAWCRELVYPVPYGTWNKTGNWVQSRDWHNKSRTRIVSRTSAQKYFISCPTSHFLPFPDHGTRVWLAQTPDGIIPRRLVRGQYWGNRRHRMDYTSKRRWEFGVKTSERSRKKRTKETTLVYKQVAYFIFHM